MKTYLKKNRALLFLPLLLLPFLVLLFYILGGGSGSAWEAGSGEAAKETIAGANFQIPEADQSIEILDKPAAYQQQITATGTMDYQVLEGSLNPDSTNRPANRDSNSVLIGDQPLMGELNPAVSSDLLAHIRQKEEELKRELELPVEKPEIKNTTGKTGEKQGYASPGSGQLVGQQSAIPSQARMADPYPRSGIEALDKVFDENLVLQAQNDSLKVYLQHISSRLQHLEKQETTRFTLEKQSFSGFGKEPPATGLIKAEIYQTATVLSGNRVKLRLLEDTWLEGKKIARNTFLYGICNITNERLHINILQVPVEEHFVPVDLTIHDLDGLPGLYVPGNAARKVTREVGSSTNTSSLFGVTNDPLTYAGIRAADRTAQTLLKRVRLKKVTVKKNTLVYLVNNNENQK